MSFKYSDQFNFLLDEFFVYQGLDDLEKNSIKQDNKLDSMMQNCYDLLNEIKKIKSKITKKFNKIQNSSIINKNNPNIIKRSSNKYEIRNNSKLNLTKRKSFGITEINNSNHNYSNDLLSNNINKSNKNIILSHFKKNKIINYKKLYSSNLICNNRINLEKININEQKIKNLQVKKHKKRQFKVLLLD